MRKNQIKILIIRSKKIKVSTQMDNKKEVEMTKILVILTSFIFLHFNISSKL